MLRTSITMKRPAAPTITLPKLSRLLGIPERSLYRWTEARGPLPLTQAISAIEAELHDLYSDRPRARRIRRFEDAVRELRVERALHHIQNRPKARRRDYGSGP